MISAAAPPAYYWYHGGRVSLRWDGSSMAVQYRTAGPPKRRRAIVESAGIPLSSTRDVGFGQWSVVNFQTPAADPTEYESRIRQTLVSSEVRFASPVFIGADNTPIVLTPHILVRFLPQRALTLRRLLRQTDTALTVVEERFGGMPGACVLQSSSRSGFDVLTAANRLVESGVAEWAEPDMIVQARGESIPNDPLFPQLWGIHNTGQFGGTPGADMKGDLAWNITTGDPSVIVMVIDCGVQQDHPDIHQLPGIDFTGQGGGGGPVNSCDNHGTAVAGCVAGIINNGIGIAGIAPNCYVISARTLVANSTCDNTYTSQISWTVNALAYAGSHGIRITNFSNQFFGTTSSALESEYQYTHDNLNMVHFAAVGNGNTAVYYPASIPVVNAVGAMASNGVRASFSNYGSALDFMAPGDSIWVTDRTGNNGYTSGDYYRYRGSSFASPYAAGVAALILSRFPWMTSTQVEAKLKSSSVDYGAPGYDTYYGWGFVNAYNAVRSSCIIAQPSNITVAAPAGQCGATVTFPTPTTTGDCSPVTCTPPSGSYFPVGTTWVQCTDTTGNQAVFSVTVTGGGILTGTLRDNFNRANNPLPGSSNWSLIANQPSGGSIAIVNSAAQATSTAGNYNFGGVVWDTLMGAGTEASATIIQKSGNTTYSSLFIYAKMNNKDYNTGTGYRLRYLQGGKNDRIEIHRVGPGYAVSTTLASANLAIGLNSVLTFRVGCDNKTLTALVNGKTVITVTDQTYMPAQWYFALDACVFPTPFRFDNFTVSSQPSSGPPPLPAVPTLASPANGATNQPTTLTLTWNAAAGASTYRVQIATDSLFASIVLDDSTLTTTSRQFGPATNNTTYYWHVNAKNGAGTSSYSAAWKFTTTPPAPPPQPPAAPTLLAPANGIACQWPPMTFSWNASSGATRYHFQIATDTLFSALIVDDTTLTSTSRQVSGLAGSTNFFWRVFASNSAGTSPPSSRWAFTTFMAGALRDDFNRANGPLPGSNQWTLIQNQPSGGTMVISNNMITPSSDAGNYNFGGVAWDSLVSGGAEASLTLKQKSGDGNYSSFFIYARMNSLDYSAATGYRLRYQQQPGSSTDLLEIHRMSGYTANTTLASVNTAINVGDVITFRVLCDNQTMVGLVNGVPVITVTDNTYSPAQWYFAVRGCVFPTPVLLDNFMVTPLPAPPAAAHPFVHLSQLESRNPMPKDFGLEQNYPNPFNPSTEIHYALPSPAYVTLKVYNILGQEVATLIDATQSAGFKSVTFRYDNLPSGVYLYRLAAGAFSGVRKMILAK